MADDRDLVVLIAGRRAGVVAMDTQGRFALRYDEEYRAGRNPTPLSLSMPLAQSHHGDGPVRAFLWGLLPDNEQVLQRWARTYQVSAGNPFALLRHVGEDCAGAAQFVRPERVDVLMAGAGDVQWLDEEEVPQRLREHVVPASAATDAVNRFVDALAYNWIIGGTDAHAKNYSVLLSGSQVRLARLYDIATASTPYTDDTGDALPPTTGLTPTKPSPESAILRFAHPRPSPPRLRRATSER